MRSYSYQDENLTIEALMKIKLLKTLIGKWVSTVIGFPILAVLIALVVLRF